MEDLRQELTWRLHRQRQHFDPARGSLYVFVNVVVDRHAATLDRDSQTEKRQCAGNRVALKHAEIEQLRAIDDLHHADQRRRDLALDVAEVLANLPEELRAVAEALKTDNVAAAARKLGVPRSTLMTGGVRSLLRRFRQAGLDKYVQRVSSPRARTG